MLLFKAVILLLLLPGCGHICATEWSSTTGVSHDSQYGQGIETSITVGGGIGEDACVEQK